MNNIFFKQKQKIIQIILGIETSCDETAAAVYHTEKGLLAHKIYSQTALHNQYGGVVPELASRDHIKKLTPIIGDTLALADVSGPELSAVAYTAGPGLIGALMVGASVACGLAYSLGIKAIPIHHMEAHLLAPLIDEPGIEFPFTALLVSGGHTLLVHVTAIGKYRIIGDSIDDAVGEAFDKTARMLGLPMPGGPELSRLALFGKPDRFCFPRPMTNRSGLDFSFSGLKTHALNAYNKTGKTFQDKADIAFAFEEAVARTIKIKCERALKQTGNNRLVAAGGVSANRKIRAYLANLPDTETHFPRLEFCTDNGAMVAFAGAIYADISAKDLVIHARARKRL